MANQKKHRPIIRHMSVFSPCYIPFKSRSLPHPVIRLAGQWLQDCGFGIGEVVEITRGPGRLTITLALAQKDGQVRSQLQQQNIPIV